MGDPLDPLAEALALGEGFQLLLLVVPSIEVADAALGRLLRRVGSGLTRLAPPQGDVDIAALETAILDRLSGSTDASALVIDASGATNRDEPAWEEVFRRLNTRRNGIARQVDCALILCVTPRMEELFAREAPDFWSIRSVRVEVKAAIRPRRIEEPSLRFEDVPGLAGALARVYPGREEALRFLAGLGFPPDRLPLSDVPDFWERVLREVDRGAFPGGMETLVRAAFRGAPGDSVIAELHGRLPVRQRASWEWVLPKEDRPEDHVEALWEPALRERLDAMQDGDWLAVVGDEHSGKWSAIQRWPFEGGSPGWVLRSNAGIPFGDYCSQLADRLNVLDPALAEVLRAAAKDRLAGAEYLSYLPDAIRRSLPADPLARVTFVHQRDLIAHALAVASVNAHVWLLWRPAYLDVMPLRGLLRGFGGPTGRWVVLIPPGVRTLLPARAAVFRLPRPDAAHLHSVLARNALRADARTRLLLSCSASQRVVDQLASLTPAVGSYLRWVEALLRTSPLPPPRAALSPEGWASAMLVFPDDQRLAVDAARLLDAGPRRVDEVVTALGVEAVRSLIEAGVLRRFPDEHHLDVAPLFVVLRPSVAARLQATLSDTASLGAAG